MKKTNIDIFTTVISLLIGILIGYIVSYKLYKDNNVKEVNVTVNNDYIYILQVAKFDNITGANNYITNLRTKNLDCICVYDKVYYYIYAQISTKEENLLDTQTKYQLLGYQTFIKKEALKERTNNIIDDINKYDFYTECINNLYASLDNKPYQISEQYKINPLNIELFTQLTILQSIKNEKLKQKAQIQAYKIIIENI